MNAAAPSTVTKVHRHRSSRGGRAARSKRAPHRGRESAIAEYHELLGAGGGLSGPTIRGFRQAMRREHLVYGDRPIGVALRPHLLEHRQFRILSQRAEAIAAALEKVAQAAVENSIVMDALGLTERERKLALVDPGFSYAGVTARLDGFVDGESIRFVEYNAENPSSLSDQEGLNRLLFDIPAMSVFAERYHLQQFSPIERLLETLLGTYREWGGHGLPNVAIVDWHGLPTESEFLLLQNYFENHGVRTVICSPDELEYEAGKLRCNDFPIDLVYKRILIHEFLSRYDDTHPLLQAYLNHDVCLVNSFRCKIMHKKASFEFLTDQVHQSWFSSEEREAIAECIPWTRRLSDRTTTWAGQEIDLLNFISANRPELVLKPNDDYGGRGVYLGSRMAQSDWDNLIGSCLSEDYVVQQAIAIPTENFPIFAEQDWKLEPMFVDTNPFLFRGEVCGAMIRLSRSPIVNVTSGGGETGFFVMAPGARNSIAGFAAEEYDLPEWPTIPSPLG